MATQLHRFALVLMAMSILPACERKATTVTDDNGRVTITFPAGYSAPERKVESVQTPLGPIQFVMNAVEKRASSCMVGYNDYPDVAFQNQSIAQMLDGASNGAVRSMQGAIEGMPRDWQYNNTHPARTIYFSGQKDGKTIYGQADYIVIQPRLYQVVFLSTEQADPRSSKIEDFFKSAQLK